MKKITLWLFALFTCWQMSAQTGTVVVGVNDGTPNTSTGDPSPLQDYWKVQRTQYLYTASELSAAGLAAGPVTEIGWIATALNGAGLQENYTISMKNTASTVLTGTFEAGSSLVYGPTDFTPSATGNVMFTLTTPFVWDGTSNVIVELCAGLSSGSYTNNVSCANSTTVGVKTVYFRNDTEVAPCTMATGTTDTTRPLLVAVGNVAACLAPLNLVSANVTAFTADVSWDASTSGSAVGYQYVVSTSSTAPAGAGTATTNTYASVGSLAPQTTHYLFVRTDCGGTFSGWNGPIAFTTACVPVTAINENFDAVTTPNLPTCWNKLLSGATLSTFATVGTTTINASAPNGVDLYNSNSAATDNIMLISPMLSNLSAGTHRLKFKARNNSATQDLEIGVLTDATDASTFTLVQAVDITTTFQSYAVNFDTFTGPGSVIALRRLSTSTYTNVYLDDIVWEPIPTCPDQTGLVVSNITSSGADTSWDDMSAGSAIGYEYAITTSATPPASGTAIASTFYIASGLLPQTVYYLHVRSECAGSTYGNWSTISFTTACAPITTLPHLEPFNTFLPNQCWMNGVNGDLTAGPAAFTASGWGADGLANNGTTGAIRNNIYMTGANDWVISPQFTIPTTGYELKFDAAAVQYAGTGTPTTPWEADDSIEVLISTTGTTNWTPLHVYNDTNQPGITATAIALDLDTYSGQTVRFAFRAVEGATDGLADIDFSIDNFQVRLSPTCPDQTGLVVSNVTAFGADTSWDDMSAGGSIGYQYAVTTSATPPASGTSTTSTFYIASSLTPQTVYYLHVRSECSGSTFGNWSTISFTTQCAPIASLPWIENFDAVTTPVLPTCWLEQNGNWETSSATTYNTAHSGTKYLRDRYGAANEYVWTPGFNLVAGTSYDFSSWIQGDGDDTWTVDFYVNSTQNSAGATQLGAQYIVPGNGTIAIQPYAQVTRSFVPATSGTYYFALKANEPSFGPWYVAIDDVELKLSPSTPPVCATNLVATPNACGNFANNLTWDLTPSANGYYVTIGTTSGGTDIANAVNVGSNNYSFSGSVNTQYFWTVVPYNGAGPATGCTEQSFTTAATGCYCTSVPSSNDNLGITTASVGATTNPIADVTYVNLTAVPEIVPQGANTNVQLTFSTGYTYDINIWIDFNNDYDFDDAGELVKTGIACTDAQPNVVDASFTMPLTAPTGPHRMRIGSADSGQVPPAPCYNGAYGVTLDFTVDTVLSSDSFEKSSFVAYPNPVKDVLNLSYKTEISNVKVINLLGQEVLNTKTNANDVKVDMSALNAGAYIVNITVEDTVHTIKVIKE